MSIPVVVNRCYGGYGLSEKAVEELRKRTKNESITSYSFDVCIRDEENGYCRHSPVLVEVVKELGTEADGKFSKLTIRYIEEKYKNHYTIEEYDGMEGICINYSQYKIDKIKEILKYETDDSIKIKCIDSIVE